MALWMALVALLAAALQAATPAPVHPPEKLAGDAACLSCHRDQGTSYLHTSHHLTSQPANKDSILGSFHEGSNVLMIADPATATDNPGLYFKMEAKPNRLLPDGGGRLAGATQDENRTDGHRDRIGHPRSELSLLARRPVIRVARKLLVRRQPLDQQPGLQGRHHDFLPGRRPALHGVPRDVPASTLP